MKVKVMLKVKAKTGKEAKEIVIKILNEAMAQEKWKDDNSKWQSWGWPKEFKK